MVCYPFKQDVNKNYQFFFFLTKKFYRRNMECIQSGMNFLQLKEWQKNYNLSG